MIVRGALRRGLALIGSVSALFACVSCYRAEVDLAPLLDDALSGGAAAGGKAGVNASVAGAGGDDGVGEGNAGEPAAGGSGGAASECDPTPVDSVQAECQRRLPTQQMCDQQDKPGWAGCYNGGCAICTEVLVDYPYYLKRHPCCEENKICGVHAPLLCSPWCPPPTELDKKAPCYELAR